MGVVVTDLPTRIFPLYNRKCNSSRVVTLSIVLAKIVTKNIGSLNKTNSLRLVTLWDPPPS